MALTPVSPKRVAHGTLMPETDSFCSNDRVAEKPPPKVAV